MKYKKLFFSRIFVSFLLIALQVTWILFLYLKLVQYSKYLDTVVKILAAVYVVYLINLKNEKMEYKLIWIILVLIFPVFGVPYYMFFGDRRPARKFKKRLDAADDKYSRYHFQDMRVIEELEGLNKRSSMTAQYILKDGRFPIYQNTEVDYFGSGEELYQAMIRSLKKAKSFIFLEYFTIEKGIVWGTILDILEKKAHEGVDVRIIYDDFGSIAYLPKHYPAQLEARSPGIRVMKFNRVVPFFSPFMNNRDHRKLLVVDGNEAFTGGLNLSDRYINIRSPYGHWKDAGVRIKGEAVWSYTTMFMEMWEAVDMRHFPEKKIMRYRPYETGRSDGFVQPYGDEPFDDVFLSENIYLEMINQAGSSVYIYTPYLIMSDELTNAICLAAKRGVDVRIVTPGIPDKKMVYRVTRSCYRHLLKSGVRIFEYTPGFLHSKCLMVDGVRATVGTVNFDYRSLFLHFENGVYFALCDAVKELEKDMKNTFRECREVHIEDTKQTVIGIVSDSLLSILAPLL